MARSLIGLGANLGDPNATLDAAVEELRAQGDAQVLAVSRWMRTAPVGGPPGQPEFLNGAALVKTDLDPHDVVARLHQVEHRHGRDRRTRWAARTLDLDLLLYDQHVVNDPQLTLPHPRMSFRPFVLGPAAEIAGGMRHPILGASLKELLDRLTGAAPLVAILAPKHAEREAIASALVTSFPGRLRPVDPAATPAADACWLAAGDAAHAPAPWFPKLSIVIGPPAPHALGGPTLWLTPNESPAEQRLDAMAAIECVWPGLG